ncbi:MAG: cell division protein ZapA [Longimicrobiales bacterium]
MSPDGNGERSSVTVRIAGEEHTIRANAEADYTRRCAKMVDDRIQRIKAQSGLLDTHRAAILAALSLTDELLEARATAEREREALTERIENVSRRLERVLEATP